MAFNHPGTLISRISSVPLCSYNFASCLRAAVIQISLRVFWTKEHSVNRTVCVPWWTMLCAVTDASRLAKLLVGNTVRVKFV